MLFHGAPLVRCENPDCKKCHCTECITVRSWPKVVIAWSERDAVFVWPIANGQLTLNVKLELK